jgi:hypothetical protein
MPKPARTVVRVGVEMEGQRPRRRPAAQFGDDWRLPEVSTARQNWIWPTFRDRVGPVPCRCRHLDRIGVIMAGRVMIMML